MMRIAIIGNSHLAAFKTGWEDVESSCLGIHCTFFGSPATGMNGLNVQDNRLVPRRGELRESLAWTSGGHESIGADYDAYILVGMGLSLVHLMALLEQHRPPSAYAADNPKVQLISDNAFDDFMAATMVNSVGCNVLDMLRQITRAPIVYVPNPYPSVDVLRDPKYQYYTLQQVRNRVFEYYLSTLSKVVSRGCVVCTQPCDTIRESMFTDPKYVSGSLKLKIGMTTTYPNTDHFHMNALYGAKFLKAVLGQYFGVVIRDDLLGLGA